AELDNFIDPESKCPVIAPHQSY
ncbi:uncharacterized protein METZ01_LOCUS367922, partial [marine metagenome]